MRIQILLFLICGILSVKGLRLSPADAAEAVEAISDVNVIDDVEKLNATDSGKELLQSVVAEPLTPESTDDSQETTKDVKIPVEKIPVVGASIVIQSTSVFQAIPLESDISRKVGPVELGLRNVVAASAAATEELYLHMTALNAETSHMINSKSEILTSSAMNDLFEPLNKVENDIKKTGVCGKGYETALNMIFKDIDSSLTECNKNLTAVAIRYTSKNVGTLTSFSIAAEDMSNLPNACSIADNFAVGTFCIVNNLAEMNDRVLSDVEIIKQNTKTALDETQKAVESTEVCQKKLVDRVTEKLSKLQKEITTNCIEKKP